MSVSKANSRRRVRSFNPVMESCEERVVPAASAIMKAVVGESLKFLGQNYVAKPLIDELLGLGTKAGFAEVNQKLDALTIKVDQLQQTLNVQVFNDASSQLKISLIDEHWRTFNNFLDRNLANNPPDKSSVDQLANSIISDLTGVFSTYAHAFNGTNTALGSPLMKLYSNAIVNTVTASATNSNPSAPFLTAYYSKKMVDTYDYYVSEEVKAAILLANAHNYKGNLALAQEVKDAIPTPYSTSAVAKQQWTHQLNTLPKYTIPNFWVIDTSTSRAWSQFNIDVFPSGNAHNFQTQDKVPFLFLIRDYLNHKGGTTLIANGTRIDRPAENQVKEVNSRLKATGLPYHWVVPTNIDINNLGLTQRLPISQAGFDPLVWNQNVWRLEHIRGVDYVSISKPWETNVRQIWTNESAKAIFYTNFQPKDFWI